jgi:hypothetical protein
MRRILAFFLLGWCAYAAPYGRLPLSFESNQGQMDSRVQFLSHGDGYSLYLTSTGAVLSLHQAVVRMTLVGGNPAAAASGVERLPGVSNYFIGNDPKAWRVGVPTFAKVKFADVYPGIDMVYYGNQRELEYDITVAPGADPGKIRLRLEGADHLQLRDGELVLEASGKQLLMRKPVLYQPLAGGRRRVDGDFVLTGKNELGFRLGAYDRAQPLVLDPVISYSTYLGGTGFDSGKGIAVDTKGSAYITDRRTPSISRPFRLSRMRSAAATISSY